MGSPRIPFQPDGVYPIYNHAVGTDTIFKEDENYHFFLENFLPAAFPLLMCLHIA